MSILGSGDVDVEKLVTWALRDQGLGWDAPGAGGVLGALMTLGTRVDTSGVVANPSPSLCTDDDALLVRQAIDALPGDQRGPVIRYGRTGLRPDWCPEGAGELDPLLDDRGRQRYEWEDDNDHRKGKRPLFDHLAYDRRLESVAYHRGEWGAWHAGLVALCAALAGKLATHRATGPAVAAEPWGDPGAQPVVHGLEGHAPAELGQPWLAPLDLGLDRTVGLTTRRAEAGRTFAPATDWDFPDRPDLSAVDNATSA